MRPSKVEMHSAWMWDCPHCGKENFTRGIVVEASPAEMAELRADFGVTAEEDGQFLAMPTMVECMSCGQEFDTTRDNEEVEGWDEEG